MSRLIILIIALCCSTALSAQNTAEEQAKLKAVLTRWCGLLDSQGIEWRPGLKRLRSIRVGTPTAGKLATANFKTNIITVSPQAMDSPFLLESAIYHELGHFIFRLDHANWGIMRSSAYSEQALQKNWQIFIKDYIKRCK